MRWVRDEVGTDPVSLLVYYRFPFYRSFNLSVYRWFLGFLFGIMRWRVFAGFDRLMFLFDLSVYRAIDLSVYQWFFVFLFACLFASIALRETPLLAKSFTVPLIRYLRCLRCQRCQPFSVWVLPTLCSKPVLCYTHVSFRFTFLMYALLIQFNSIHFNLFCDIFI